MPKFISREKNLSIALANYLEHISGLINVRSPRRSTSSIEYVVSQILFVEDAIERDKDNISVKRLIAACHTVPFYCSTINPTISGASLFSSFLIFSKQINDYRRRKRYWSQSVTIVVRVFYDFFSWNNSKSVISKCNEKVPNLFFLPVWLFFCFCFSLIWPDLKKKNCREAFT